jgi:hypothetical protein
LDFIKIWSNREIIMARWSDPQVLAAIIAAIGTVTVAIITTIAAPILFSPKSTLNKSSSNLLSPNIDNGPVCGAQLRGIALFGYWSWSGTVEDTRESGTWRFKDDCTYTNDVKSGMIANDEGSFLVNSSSSATPSITITNKHSGKTHTYLITSISENSFHASTPDYSVNLDFTRAS